MHKITLFPLGNADSMLIELGNGKKILIDYANTGDSSDDEDKRIDLPAALKDILGGEESIDVVVFTHIDMDHVKGSHEFFNFEYANEYQSDDRIDIEEMWVPAAALVEEGTKDDSRIVRQEARHRFKYDKGIKVFSIPDQLHDWAEDSGINLDNKKDLIVNAGETIDDFNLYADGVEFFVHSPFAYRTEEDKLIDRNKDAIALNIKFRVDGTETLFNTFSDLGSNEISDIVGISESYSNSERLSWDILKIPHHCSHISLDEVTAEDFEEPQENVDRLYRDYSNEGPLIVSSSKPIKRHDSDPPNKDAANYYEKVVSDNDGEFIVTMEFPSVVDPEPIVIEITGGGYEVQKQPKSGVPPIVTQRSERAGEVNS